MFVKESCFVKFVNFPFSPHELLLFTATFKNKLFKDILFLYVYNKWFFSEAVVTLFNAEMYTTFSSVEISGECQTHELSESNDNI